MKQLRDIITCLNYIYNTCFSILSNVMNCSRSSSCMYSSVVKVLKDIIVGNKCAMGLKLHSLFIK